jgi:hypothetical protein
VSHLIITDEKFNFYSEPTIEVKHESIDIETIFSLVNDTIYNPSFEK